MILWGVPDLRNPPHRVSVPGVSDQYALIYCTKVPVLTCLGGGGAGPKELRSSKVPYGLGTMLALFFAFGCLLGMFCGSCCVCCHPRSFFWHLGTLQARFRRVPGGSGEGFGAPDDLFFDVFVACAFAMPKNSGCVKTIVFPWFFLGFVHSHFVT